MFTFKCAKLKIYAREAGYNRVQKKKWTLIPFRLYSGSWVNKISTCFHYRLASCMKKCHVETFTTALKYGSCVLLMCWKPLWGSFLQKYCFFLYEASIVKLLLWKPSNVTQSTHQSSLEMCVLLSNEYLCNIKEHRRILHVQIINSENL